MICRGTMGRAMRAIFSFGSPASISFRPVTLSAAANAIWRTREREEREGEDREGEREGGGREGREGGEGEREGERRERGRDGGC